jgi:hypothetical protein
MTTFLKTAKGGLINAAFIRSIYGDREGTTFFAVVNDERDSDSVELDLSDLGVIEKCLLPIVPAEPGTKLLIAWYAYPSNPDDDIGTDAETYELPLLAWRMGSFGLTPVTIEQDGFPEWPHGVLAALMPDSRVVPIGGHLLGDGWQNKDGWLKWVNERSRDHVEREAKNKARNDAKETETA